MHLRLPGRGGRALSTTATAKVNTQDGRAAFHSLAYFTALAPNLSGLRGGHDPSPLTTRDGDHDACPQPMANGPPLTSWRHRRRAPAAG